MKGSSHEKHFMTKIWINPTNGVEEVSKMSTTSLHEGRRGLSSCHEKKRNSYHMTLSAFPERYKTDERDPLA